MRKRQEIRSIYVNWSGSSGTYTIPMPDSGRIVGVRFGGSLMVGELAAATGTSYLHAFLGSVVSPATGLYATNLIAGITRTMRSNATFAITQDMNEFIPMDVPFSKNSQVSIEYLIFANHTFAGWVSIHLEPAV